MSYAISKVITPGGRVGDNTPFGAGDNWVTRAGGLPDYIREVAHAMVRNGKTESRAIAMAVGIVRNWAEGKGKVTPKVRAAAAAAIAEWEAKRAAGHVAKGELGRVWSDKEFIASMSTAVVFAEVHKGCGCAKEKEKKMNRRSRIKKAMVKCEECGETYAADGPEEIAEHKKDHKIKKCDGVSNCKDCPMKKKKVTKRDFSNARRDKLKEQGKTDPHGGFPIEKPIDVKNAVQAIGRASDPEMEKKRIIAAAKKLGCTEMIPEGWTISKQGFKPGEQRDPATGKWSKGGGGFSSTKSQAGVNADYKQRMADAQAQLAALGAKGGGKGGGKKKAAPKKKAAKKATTSSGSSSGTTSSSVSTKTTAPVKATTPKIGGASSASAKPGPSVNLQKRNKNRINFLVQHGIPRARARLVVWNKAVPNRKEARLLSNWDLPGHKAGKIPPLVVKSNSKMLSISPNEFSDLVKSLEEVEKIDADTDGLVTFDMMGEIEKSDTDKQLVFGWCSVAKKKDGTVVVDKQGDVLEDIDQMEKVAYDFVLHSRDGGEMHIRKGVSTLVESFVSTPEKWTAMGIPEGTLPVGWWVGFHVKDTEVWKGVKSGKYKMFSVHGSGLRKAMVE